ncbi:AAA family ATPase [Nonomuraea sp. NPDC049714]|uniref:AAA family ATPase n=1 Tax=Nonomuraea sp. NPDC049714 TaxID=3364357 RepID=UPI0037B5C55A
MQNSESALPPPATSDLAAKVIEQSLTRVAQAVSDAEQAGLLGRVLDAWRGRNGRDAPAPTLVLVGGYAGSGKSEFSRYLSEITGWALLDKDSLSGAMAERLLLSLGGDPHDRHTELYLREVRPLEYRCLLETAFANLRAGTSAILSAPFIAELTDPRWTYRLTDQCTAMSVEVTIIWMRCDVASMRRHIELRGAPRDAWKLANWDAYASGLDIDNSPPSAHITVDNRFGAAISLIHQTGDKWQRILK